MISLGGSGRESKSGDRVSVVFNGTALSMVAGGTVQSIESITADLLTGTDTLSYSTTTANVSVDLNLNTASGFSRIAGIENIVGGAGADQILGNGLVNVLTGGAGNDLLNGDAGNDLIRSVMAMFALCSPVQVLSYRSIQMDFSMAAVLVL